MKFTLNIEEFNEMRNSQGVQDALNEVADRIARSAGPGFEVDHAEPGKTRAHARVYADTFEAKLAQAHHHALERAFGAS